MTAALLASAALLSAGPDTSPHSQATLVSSVSAIQPGVPFWVGLRIVMDKDWHSYWLFPGDSGQATAIKWSLPAGWRASELKWPVPTVHPQDDFTTYIYENEVILMAQITPPKTAKAGSAVTLSGNANWLICEESCVPAREKVSIKLPIAKQAKANPTWAPRLAAVQKQWPAQPSAWQFSAFQDGEDIILRGNSKAAFNAPRELTFVPSDGDTVKLKPTYSAQGQTNGFVLRMPISEYASKKPTHLRGLLLPPKGMLWNGQAAGFELNIPISRQR